MAVKKRDRREAAAERLSRNPRPSRQSKTVSGKPLFSARRPLQELRAEVGISQPQLARAAGVPVAAIANIESKRYALSARHGAAIYKALAKAAIPESPQYREARQEVGRLTEFQSEITRKARIAYQGQLESIEKKLKGLDALDAEMESYKAWLNTP